VHTELFIDIVAAVVLEAFRLGVSLDGDLDTRDLKAFEMDPGAGDIEGGYPLIGRFDRCIIKDWFFTRISEVVDVFAFRAAFVEEGDACIDVFGAGDLGFGHMIEAAAYVDGVARADGRLSTLDRGKRAGLSARVSIGSVRCYIVGVGGMG